MNAKPDGSASMRRFAILNHDYPYSHWDFLLEDEIGLRAWRLASAPERKCTIRAEEIAIHRCEYLDYEGPVGGGRGSVFRWDGGTYSVGHWDEKRLEIEMAGNRLRGLFQLVHIDGKEWSFNWVA